MKRLQRIGQAVLIGVITAVAPGRSWGDILNTATASYADPGGLSYAITSNTWAIGMPAAALPAPDLSALDGKTFGLQDEISFSYPVSDATFEWKFTAATSNEQRAMSPASRSLLSGAPATTSAPRFTPASAGLAPGAYQLTVTATRGSERQSATANLALVSTDLSAVKVYPNPWRADKHATKNITFANLPSGSTVKLFTVSGHKVAEFKESGGSTAWDLKTDKGDPAASGIYMYLITDRQGNKIKGKAAVIR